MSKPNLFRYATSELSQDAIIGWLLEWAKTENKMIEKDLYTVGVRLINSFFDKCQIGRPSKYINIEVKKQYKNIDILCIINDKYSIIVEDKTGTKNHSNQLNKYREIVEKDFPNTVILPIYFKTGDQSNYDSVKLDNYVVFTRRDFLKVLSSPYRNDILSDYHQYLQAIENAVNSYKNLPFEQWTWSSWKGFFKVLQDKLQDGNWDYVANRSGGFLGFWWNWNSICNTSKNGSKYSLYMQIDVEKMNNDKTNHQCKPPVLKFKISSGSKEKVDRKIINYWKKHIQDDNSKYKIIKPGVVRAGRWTTIGLLEGEENFLSKDPNGLVIIDGTVDRLLELEKILKNKIDTEIII
jgi:hypothetical protein